MNKRNFEEEIRLAEKLIPECSNNGLVRLCCECHNLINSDNNKQPITLYQMGYIRGKYEEHITSGYCKHCYNNVLTEDK